MSDAETLYLTGVIAAMVVFAIALFYASTTVHR